MFARRFVLLASILVALNLALWFGAPGLALRNAIVQQLLGQNLIRADVVTKSGDWQLDRGVIASVDSWPLTVREADGRVQSILLSPTTKVFRLGRRLPLGSSLGADGAWSYWPASGAAVSVDVERIPAPRLS